MFIKTKNVLTIRESIYNYLFYLTSNVINISSRKKLNKGTKSICFKCWVVCYLKSRCYLIWKYTCTTLHWSNSWYHCQKYGYVFPCTPYIIQANSTHKRFWSSLIQPSNKEDMPHTQYEKHIGLKQWKEKHIPFNVNLLGQGSVAHGCVSAGTPEQITPPFAGGGLVHVWILSWDPVPHVTVQAPQSVHADHPPSTGISK